MWAKVVIAAWFIVRTVDAAFGLSSKGNSWSVDTNAGLVFEVSKSTGDITSLLYNGVQYQGTSKMTHINSGLGASRVSADIVNGYVRITVAANTQPVTQYLVAKPDDPTIYLATHITREVDPGELRFLARLRRSAVPNGWHGDVANLDGCSAFEGKDTFKCPNGQTRCKMYTSDRFIDDKVHGVTGKNVGIWMIMPGTAYESSAGGPFMRDINTQSGDDQELYWYMNSGHVRTEPWRFGLMGPYAMKFTTGAQPSADLDTSFFANLSIQGYVPSSKRGSISGSISGIPSKFQAVIHWYNNASQYWAIASPSGRYTSPLMRPGTYTMKLYRNEFQVAQDSVTISIGDNPEKNVSSTEPTPSVVWRIGEFDGQPFELKNGDKIERMHPEDVRMGTWGGSYTVGKSTAREFPMALFAKQGGTASVTFNLSKEQAGAETILRVGTTLSFKGGRPSVKIGSWSGKDFGAPKLIDSRGVTRGAYRGYGEVYTWKIPPGTMKEGANTLVLGVHGSGDAKFLSANYVIDAVELQGPKGSDSPIV